MEKSDKDALYVALSLIALFIIDLAIVGGILIKGHANFVELIKHLKQ